MKTEITKAAARATIYKQLARGFLYPSETLQADLTSGDYSESLFQAAKELDMDAKIDLPDNYEELVSDYIYYFDIGNRQPPCAPYAGIYFENAKRSAVLLQLSEVYKNFGLQIADKPHELQDHLSVELEFMYFLCFKEIQSLREEDAYLKGYRRAQEDFLKQHLMFWLPGFLKIVEEKCQNNFYRSLASLCSEFVVNDAASL